MIVSTMTRTIQIKNRANRSEPLGRSCAAGVPRSSGRPIAPVENEYPQSHEMAEPGFTSWQFGQRLVATG